MLKYILMYVNIYIPLFCPCRGPGNSETREMMSTASIQTLVSKLNLAHKKETGLLRETTDSWVRAKKV